MDVLEFSALVEANWKYNLLNLKGDEWVPEHSFYKDLAIAEFCEIFMNDKGAIVKTYKELVKNYKSDYKALTELVLVLNHKIWAYYEQDGNAGIDARFMGISKERGNKLAKVYDDLWKKTEDLFYDVYKDNEYAKEYFFQVTD